MTPERWQQLKPLFFEALDRPPEARAAFLDQRCGSDAALRAELEGLLAAAEEDAPTILDASPEDLAHLVETEAGALPSPALVGQTVGPYRIVREIGRGGMGAVYLAERADVDKHVALKLVRHHLADPGAVRRFLDERRILARLDHPNVARLLDAGMTGDGTPFFAMDYVDGRPLTDYCDRRQLTVGDRLALFAEVCEAVRYAHQNLVIHRDLKPSNILVAEDEDGRSRVKLLDFGIAKLIEDDAGEAGLTRPGMTRTGLRAMTPAYAAPEQVRGRAVTTATDVYALGMLLYELLAGRRPYEVERRTAGEVERVICGTQPVKPSVAAGRAHRRPGGDGSAETTTLEVVSAARSTEPARLLRRLRGDLDVVCMKALAKEPAERYPSAEALLEDLRRHQAGLPIEARPSTVGYRVRRFVARHRLGVASAVATAGLIAALIGFYTWRLAGERDRVARERDRAEHELARSEAVTGFLMDLFEAGDPAESLGETLTVYDLLERGAARAGALEEEPLVQAQMLEVIGSVYRKLGDSDPAQPLLERALAIRRATLGETHLDVASSLDSLASLRQAGGDYDAAETLFRQALAIRRQLLGETHLDVTASMNNLALLLQYKGDHGEAETLHRQVLALRRQSLGAEHARTVTSMHNLAALLHRKGSYDEAETLFRQVLAADRATLGDTHPDLANDAHNLGLLLIDKGDYGEAEALLKESRSMLRKTLGNEHPKVAGSLAAVAMLLTEQGRYDEAEEHLRQALAIYRAKLGESHPYTLVGRKNLGVVLTRKGGHAAAEALLRQTLAMHREQDEAKQPRTARVERALADVLAARGEHAAAEPLYRQALATQRELLPADHLNIADTLGGLAALHAARGDTAAAEQLYRQALAIQRQRLQSHPKLAATLKALAGVLAARGDPTAAEPLYREALAIYRDRLGETNAWTLEVRAALDDLAEAGG